MLTITFCLEDGPKRYSEWPLRRPANSAGRVYTLCVLLRSGSGYLSQVICLGRGGMRLTTFEILLF